MANKGKIIIISAPSGTGKSTIINRIIADTSLDLQFSISATSREPRKGEAHGVNYYFSLRTISARLLQMAGS